MFFAIFVISYHHMEGSRSVPTKQQSARVRRIVRILFYYLSPRNHLSNFFFTYSSLKHTLDRMDSKNQVAKTHGANLRFSALSFPIIHRSQLLKSQRLMVTNILFLYHFSLDNRLESSLTEASA
jgi:hypothetical protein